MFPDPGSAIDSQHESVIVPNTAKDISIFEANIWGLLFYRSLIGENEGGNSGIHSYRVVGLILLFIRHSHSMLKDMGYVGPILIETSLAAIKEVAWLQGAGFGAISSRPGSEFDDQFAFAISSTTEELEQRPGHIAMEVVRSIFFSVNRYEMADTTEKLEELIRMGYQFNSWGRPPALRA